MARIAVDRLDDTRYRVTVQENGSATQHDVTVTREHVERYAPGATPERLLEASFEFLLAREPKESILRNFELPVIARYFPDYPVAIRGAV
jgi:hypothetical protein